MSFRAIGACALSLLMPTSLLLAAEPGSALEMHRRAAGTAAVSQPVLKAVTQRVHLAVLPQIVQPGGKVANANAAKAAITATFKPIKPGRKVKLQVRRGSSWRTVTTVREDRKGRVQLAAPARRNGEPLTYRVRAVRYQGLPAVKSRPRTTERWLKPTWTDQFKGSSLSNAWTHRGQAYEPTSLRRCSKGSPKAVRVGGGTLRLSVIRDPNRTTRCPALKKGKIAGRYAYRLNGHVGTQEGFSFKYGFAAARIKFHRVRGQHGSFWLQPLGGMRPDSTGHEIDVCEFFGGTYEKGGLWTFIHRYEGSRVVKRGVKIPNSYLQGPRDGWGKKFHVFSVQWKPHLLIFRIDGKETWRIGGRISQVPQYLILSLLSSDYELPLMTDRQLPQHMYVDWVRVWETSS